MTMRSLIKGITANVLSGTGVLDLLWKRGTSWKILMYHRVCNPEDVRYPIQSGMYVRPDTFKMHCLYLKQNANVIPVEELIVKLQNRVRVPERTIAITFDDGWKDNLENAFPILKSMGLPATIFLPTSYIGTNKLFWTDEIARALRFSPEVFKEFDITKKQKEEDQLELILKTLFSLKQSDRDKKVERLTSQLPKNTNREFLTWEEVLRLDNFGIKVGSHSHTHRLFKELPRGERESELIESGELLRSKGLFTSRVFVFPGGSYTEEMGMEPSNTGYLASLKTTPSYNGNSLIYPRIGIHQDISSSIELYKFRLCFT